MRGCQFCGQEIPALPYTESETAGRYCSGSHRFLDEFEEGTPLALTGDRPCPCGRVILADGTHLAIKHEGEWWCAEHFLAPEELTELATAEASDRRELRMDELMPRREDEMAEEELRALHDRITTREERAA